MEIKPVEKIGNYKIHYDNEYGLAFSPIDYKKLEMTAKEMFEKLGYELIQDNMNWLKYSFDRRFDIEFYKPTKTIYMGTDEVRFCSINVQELKAIKKQIEELGWDNE